MAAAATKMDELLVSWLGSDTVYEEVLKLIETYRSSSSSSSPLTSPSSSPTRKSSNSNRGVGLNHKRMPLVMEDGGRNEEKDSGKERNTTLSDYFSGDDDDGKKPSSSTLGGGTKWNEDELPPPPTSTRTTTNDTNTAAYVTPVSRTNGNGCPIPPFYRPPGTYTRNGTKIAPLRRKRAGSFEDDQTWDGRGSLLPDNGNDDDGGGGGVDAEKKEGKPTNPTTTAMEPITVSSSSSTGKGETEQGPSSTTTTKPIHSSSTTTPSPPPSVAMPIKDRVAVVFRELGRSPTSSNTSTPINTDASSNSDTTEQQQPSSSLPSPPPHLDENTYLTVDSFVKITKDICRFPTFFNGPLYRRILYLWNAHKPLDITTNNNHGTTTTTTPENNNERTKRLARRNNLLYQRYETEAEERNQSVIGIEPPPPSLPPPSSPTTTERNEETNDKNDGEGEGENKTTTQTTDNNNNDGDDDNDSTANDDENDDIDDNDNRDTKQQQQQQQRRMQYDTRVTHLGGDVLVTYRIFRWFWTKEMEDCDLSDRFYNLVKKPMRDYIGREDFGPFITELLRDHPGLEFLSNHAEFQEKYALTVVTRIFYSVDRCHSGRITARQIRRSDLVSAFRQVDEEEDINKVTRYFSYEHFYVLYCRFWELDHDRDYKIVRDDLMKYGDQCLSHMIVDRIFDAAPRPFEGDGSKGKGEVGDGGDNDNKAGVGGMITNDGDRHDDPENAGVQPGTNITASDGTREYLTYEDFIFFMLSEEDKTNEISVRYWFNCLDVDGDGKLNNMEMRSFYALQQHRMQHLGHEHIPFEDMLCQMIDMIKPANEDYLVVEDFLQTECFQVSGALFDALFNLNKYVQFEQRDPYQERQKREDEFETDWDRFACMDYNRLAMEEEAREEDGLEIDWVTVDDEDEEGEELDNSGALGGANEAPF